MPEANPPPARTIPHVAIAAAAIRGAHPAVIEGTRQISYSDLAAAMMQAAAAFVRAGLVKGDRVAIHVHNGIDWIVACLGAQAAGGVVVPISTRFKGPEIEYVLNRSRARFLVQSGTFLGTDFAAMVDGLDLMHLERRILVPTDERPLSDWRDFLAWGQADPASRDEAEERLAGLLPDDYSDIMYTSGTTGAPKGVVTCHGQNVAVYREWVRATTLNADDRYLLIWPFFHCSGYKSGWLATLIAGATLYPEATFDVTRLIARVAAEGITVLPGPPTLFQTLLASPEARGGQLATLRVTVTGATMVAPTLIEAMRDQLGLKAIFTGYGLTESCGTATMTDAGDGPDVVVTSPGKAIRGVELVCLDADGRPLPHGREGEVAVRGINVMRGYFEDPEATRATIDAAGWLHTGDVGVLDERGYLRVTGRKKDIYIVGGFNCYPAEIENVIMKHPAVAEVAVTGIPDERLGEVGKAYVIAKQGMMVDEAGLIAWCQERMANYKVPRAVAFVGSLPRTSTGKVQKFRLASGDMGE